jgi:hypothetical protein
VGDGAAVVSLDEGTAFAAIGLMVVESINMYRSAAPSLKDIRSAPPGDPETAQMLLDADILGVIVVLAIGGSGAVIIKRAYPLILACVALLLVSAYYRSVARSSNVNMG